MKDEEHIRPFCAWLRELNGGRTQQDLTDALAQLTQAVVEHGKGGTLTLQLTVKPAAKRDEFVLSVSDKLTVKAPAGDRGESIFFADGTGNLTRSDPRQLELSGMRVMEGGAGRTDHDDAEEAREA